MKSPLFVDERAAEGRRGAAPAGAQRAGLRPGLVTSQTSDTACAEVVEIDPVATRLRRLRRSVSVAARLFSHFLGRYRFKPAMLTLTYRDVDAFSPRDISKLLQHIRQWMRRRGQPLRYVWVAELQKRGALHYHVLVWLPRGFTLPKPDKQGWWPHGHTRIEWARNAVGYLCKYVSKLAGAQGFPKGIRLHGSGGHEEEAKQVRGWFNLPSWLRALAGVGERFVRVKGVGLVERDTGVCVPSPWRVSFSGGRVFAQKLFDHPGSLEEVGGPYSRLAFVRGK